MIKAEMARGSPLVSGRRATSSEFPGTGSDGGAGLADGPRTVRNGECRFRSGHWTTAAKSHMILPIALFGPVTSFLFWIPALCAIVLLWWFLKRSRTGSTAGISRRRLRLALPRPLFRGGPLRFQSQATQSATQPQQTGGMADLGTVSRPSGDYRPWNKRLPVSRRVIDQIHIAAKQETPISAVLLTTSPPTVKLTEDGSLPVVTELKLVSTLEEVQLLTQTVPPERIVATFHNHETQLDVLPHDAKLFLGVDSQLGNKLHLIGSRRGIQFYSANGDDPEIPSSREREQDRR